ncbi:MAG: hypothetical protein ACI9TH_003069 [Kiritimatiellia bacterium]|jgi:hypothetical protein
MKRIVLVPLCALICTALLTAQEPPASGPAPAPAPKPTPAPTPLPTPDPERKDLREQSIYIPYEQLWKVFEKEGRGVFLPHERFMELWKASNTNKMAKPDVKAPIDSLITDVDARVTVEEDVVKVTSSLSIEVLKEGWNQIPLRLADAAITGATLDGKPARITFVKEKGYQLLIEKTGKAPRTYTLKLDYAKSFTKSPGRNSVSFQAPSAPVSKWDVKIPESGVKVDILPMLATTDVPVAGDARETHVLAFVGATPTVQVDWTPKAEGAKGLTALVSVRSEQSTVLEEGVMRNHVTLHYDISRMELTRFELEVPADQKVVNVFDENVREWSVEQTNQVQRVMVELFEPTKGKQKLVVELEQFSDAVTASIPVIKALNAGRQQGVLAVRVDDSLRAEISGREGLLQLDVQELPEALRAQSPQYSYRYAAVPYKLEMQLEKVQPRIIAETLNEFHLDPRKIDLQVFARFDVQRAGVFELKLLVPEGFEILKVAGQAAANVADAQVDGHHLADPVAGMREMTINLSRKAFGRVGVKVDLKKVLNEADLLSPTGKQVLLSVPIVREAAGNVERGSGFVVVYGPESLRINPAEPVGLRAVKFVEAVSGGVHSQRPDERPVLSYAFGQEAASLGVEVERRAPYVTVRQLLTAGIESGVVKYSAKLFYHIQYSGVSSLRLDVPASEADQIRILTTGIRHSAMTVTNELAEGSTAWKLEGETEFSGQVVIHLNWEKKIEKLDIGKKITIAIPRLIPREVDRSTGQIVLTKSEGIDVSPAASAEGLRPIDPRMDLMAEASVSDAAQAYEFLGDWALNVEATRYETREVKATSIERGLVRTVITRGSVNSVQAVYRMRSKEQRLTITLPPKVDFDSQPLRINGRPVPLEQGQKGEFFVPLTSLEQDKAFLLELRYIVADQGKLITGPVFPGDPAIQQVYMSVHYPDNRAYIGHAGSWNEEMVWVLNGFSTYPRGKKSGKALVAWVSEGLNVNREGLNSFAMDGRSLLFSTLRPEASGVLRIRLIPAVALNLLVLAVVIAIGITQLNASMGRRALVVGAALVAVILVAVFAPSLARSLVTNGAMAAGAVVLIIWAIWYLLVQRPRDPVVVARREAQIARAKAMYAAPQAAAASTPPPPLPAEEPPAEPSDKGDDDA